MKEIIKNVARQKAVCIQAGDIVALAQQGLDRALAARQAMTELSADQAKEVGGGLVVPRAIIAGGYPVFPLASAKAGIGGVVTSPAAIG